jgi:hypothetical protein
LTYAAPSIGILDDLELMLLVFIEELIKGGWWQIQTFRDEGHEE